MEVYQIISLVVSILTLCGFGYIAKNFWSDRREAKKNKTAEAKERMKRENQQQIREVVEEVVAPIKEDLKEVKEDLKNDKTSTIVSLRATMKQLRDKYCAQGYVDTGDRATWRELYNDYVALGGNNFKEFVNGWKEDVESLPKEPVQGEK